MTTASMLVPPDHPSLTVVPRPFRDWNEWLSLWAQAGDILGLGLLHAAFSPANDFTAIDELRRLRFFLGMATRWYDGKDFFRRLEEVEIEHWQGADIRGEGRRQLAEKAMAMLCERILRPAGESPQAMARLANSELLAPIVDFFLPVYNTGRPRIANLGFAGGPHFVGLARDFLRKLCEFGLAIHPMRGEWPSDEVRVGYGGSFVQVLAGLSQLRMLLGESAWQRLPETAFEALRKLAYNEYFGDTRPKSLAASVAAGNQAASVLRDLTDMRRHATG